MQESDDRTNAELGDRLIRKLQEISLASIDASSKGEILYITIPGIDTLLPDSEFDGKFSILPAIVLVSHEVRQLRAGEFVTVADGGLSGDARNWFDKGIKYTPVLKYQIYGNDTDLMEGVFRFVVKDEEDNNSALIEIQASLKGATNTFIMTPWGHETHITFDSNGNLVTRTRRNRKAEWI